MDYNSLSGCLGDWDRIAHSLVREGTVTFAYSDPDKVKTYIVSIAGPLFQIGFLPHGGQASGRFMVGVTSKGCFYFDLYADGSFYADFVAEKLGLSIAESLTLTELLNEIKDRLHHF